MSPQPHWITLGAASRFLGVDASTLRAWADAGRIPTFRTPGGHRRFARDDLQALVGGHQTRAPQVARQIRRHGQTLARRRRPRAAAWYTALDPASRSRLRRTCRTLMRDLAGYLAGGSRRVHLSNGRRSGSALGGVLQRRGLSASQATGAFLHFRGVMGEMVMTRLGVPAPQQVRALRQIDHFLNQVMLAMLEALGRPQARAPRARRSGRLRDG